VKRSLAIALVFSLVTSVFALDASDRVLRGSQVAIASASAEASRAGLEVWDAGGNVVDAAIAVTFAISVARPQSTGLGGGGFFLVRDAGTGEIEALDARECGSAKANPALYKEAHDSLDGAHAVAVPGLVAGALDLHARRGILPLARVLAPAIRLAREGVPVTAGLAQACRSRKAALARDPEAARIFLKGGEPLRAGTVLFQPDLARVLERIAAKGRAGFDEGEVAAAIESATGGFVTKSDLHAYAPKRREPLRSSYRGHDLATFPLPSSGGVVLLEMLHMLELAPADEPEGLHAHRLVEVERRAYADRAAFLGDPDSSPKIPWKTLVSRDYAKERAKSIDLERATGSKEIGAGPAPKEADHTTHFSVVDSVGNAVASTQTINGSLGAALVAPGTGIVLNNEVDDFTTRPGKPNLFGLVQGEANVVGPGKRPLSSMTPTFVFEGKELAAALGSPGGSRIITAVLATLLARIDRGLGPEASVAAPRIHHQWLPDEVLVEPTVPFAVVSELERRGHVVRVVSAGTDVEAVFRDPRTKELTAVSDARGEGRPAAR
jgi:gamma-glutamyltranspeptidase/glutathione hydrolase